MIPVTLLCIFAIGIAAGCARKLRKDRETQDAALAKALQDIRYYKGDL